MDPLETARASGLVREREPLLVLLSGGADSVCLLDVAVRLGARVSALHVNYGLRGVEPRRGRLVRPLLRVSRFDTYDYCGQRGLEWREDASNADPRFARARIRHEVMPVLPEIGPSAEETIVETAELLRDEAEVL